MHRLMLAGLCLPALFAQKWTIQYFYDEDRSRLELTDLAFPSAERGIAVGTIQDEREGRKPRYTALVSSDGGAKWSLVPLKEFPRSIFFLNDSLGWLVTPNAIWFTEESGRTWTKVSDQIKPSKKFGEPPPGGLILRVWFLDPQHGFAAGLQRSVFETRDGGRSWSPVEEAPKPPSNPQYTSYSRLAFADARHGLIVGGYSPPGQSDLPSWMEPERAMRRYQFPTLALLLETHDGGAKWISSTAPLFGSIASLRLAGVDGLAVFVYNDSFEWPSEVYHIDLSSGKSESVFRENDRRVTDSAVFTGRRAFLAAVEPPGRLHSTPIPGKVKMLTSANLKDWTELEVDYKAVARSLVLAGPDADHLWAATDTGMILRLTPK
jgi:hypothetical protein